MESTKRDYRKQEARIADLTLVWLFVCALLTYAIGRYRTISDDIGSSCPICAPISDDIVRYGTHAFGVPTFENQSDFRNVGRVWRILANESDLRPFCSCTQSFLSTGCLRGVGTPQLLTPPIKSNDSTHPSSAPPTPPHLCLCCEMHSHF